MPEATNLGHTRPLLKDDPMSKIAGYQVHPLAEVFPLIEGDEFDALVANIKAHGLREPITLYGGQILDGRNRARACQRAKVEIKTRNYKGKDPVGYVVSLNLKRRHLDASQRAVVADELATMKQGARTDLAEISARSQAETAELLNVDRRSVQHARKVREKADPELVEAVKQGHVTVSAAASVIDRPKAEQRKVARASKKGEKPSAVIRELNRKDREKKMESISRGNKGLKSAQKFGVILADPPWLYNEGTTTPNRRIDNHYPPMPLEDICALPVKKLGLPDSALFLWITSPLLLEAAQPILTAWGYDYKSSWIWLKEGKTKKDGDVGGYRGTGHWAIIEHEMVLIAVRGDVPVPPPSARFKSWFKAPVGDHSKKPDEVHKRIEKMFPKASRVELFARTARKGWSVWGNQAQEEEEE